MYARDVMLNRRGLLIGLGATLVAAPAIVRIESLMKLPSKTFAFTGPWLEMLSGGKVVGVRCNLAEVPPDLRSFYFRPATENFVVDGLRIANAFGVTRDVPLTSAKSLLNGDTLVVTSPLIKLL